MAEDGKIVYKVNIDDSGVDRQASNAGEKAGKTLAQKIGSGMKLAGAAVGAGLMAGLGAAASAVASIGKAAVEGFADYEQLVGGVETLFGTGGMQLEEYAQKVGKSVDEVSGKFSEMQEAQDLVLKNAGDAYKTAGLSANEYMETVTSFSASLISALEGDTVAAAKLADQAIIDMSDNANKMGSDMESIQAAYAGFSKQNYTLLDNLKLGYGGTKTEMERLIQDAEKLNSSFKATRDENGNLAMSYDEIVQAIHIVQTEMGITGTTAKEASSTISGSINMTKAAWKNLMTGLASGENVDKLIDNLVQSGEAVLENLLPVIERALGSIGEAVEKVAPIIAEKLPNLVSTVLPPLLSAATSLLQGLVAALPTIIQSLSAVIPQVVDVLTNPAMISLLIDAGITLLVSLIDGVSSALPQLLEQMPVIIEKMVTGLINNAGKLLECAKKLIESLLKGVALMFAKTIEIGGQLVGKIIDGLKERAQKLLDAGKELIQKVVDAFKNTDWKNLGKNIVDGILEGLKAFWNNLTSWIGDAVSGLIGGAKKILGVQSPSKEFKYIGRMTVLGMEEGLEDEEVGLKRTFDDIFDPVFSAISGVGSLGDYERSATQRMSAVLPGVPITVNSVLNIDGRAVARATAWQMGEQLAWEEMS